MERWQFIYKSQSIGEILWDYILDSADYKTKAEFSNIGTVSVSKVLGAEEEECG